MIQENHTCSEREDWGIEGTVKEERTIEQIDSSSTQDYGSCAETNSDSTTKP